MSKDVLDTNIYITYQEKAFAKDFPMSAVVLQEMTVGSSDNNELRFWELTRKSLEAKELLLVPNGEDWFLAGKILNSLLRGLKSKNKGKTPKLSPDDKQRIIRDVLIARTVKRENARLVTGNIKDFELIKRFCNIKLISGKDYFGE
jgi:predicted nucleic acid-binding protein